MGIHTGQLQVAVTEWEQHCPDLGSSQRTLCRLLHGSHPRCIHVTVRGPSRRERDRELRSGSGWLQGPGCLACGLRKGLNKGRLLVQRVLLRPLTSFWGSSCSWLPPSPCMLGDVRVEPLVVLCSVQYQALRCQQAGLCQEQRSLCVVVMHLLACAHFRPACVGFDCGCMYRQCKLSCTARAVQHCELAACCTYPGHRHTWC